MDILEDRSSLGVGNTFNWLFYSKLGGGGLLKFGQLRRVKKIFK